MDNDKNNHYIVIIGNFGSGQDIITRFLKKKFKKIKVVQSLNNHSPDFISQMETTCNLYDTIIKNDKFYKNSIFLCDTHPLFIQNCIIPSLKIITNREEVMYRKWLNILEPYSIKLIIQLTLDTNKCFERMLSIDPNIEYNILKSMEIQLNKSNKINDNLIKIDMNKYINIEENEMLEKELFRELIKYNPMLFNNIIT